MENYFISINHIVSLSLNHFVIKYNLQTFVGIFSDLPIFFLPVFLIFFWLYYTFKKINKKDNLLYIFYSAFIGISVNLILQHFFHEKRPETLITPILKHVPDNSFPSDHAAVSFAFLTALYLFGYKKTFWLFLPFVLIMNLCRIAGGVHWFFDVIVGGIIGICSAFLIYKIKDTSYLKKLNSFILKIASFFKL